MSNMSIKSWWNRLFRLTIKSQFVNLCKLYGQPKYLQLNLILAERHKKTHYYPWLPFVYLLELWKPTFLVGWFLTLGCVNLLFLKSLHLNHLFHMLLHKSGTRQNRVLRITGTRYEENKAHLIQF